MTHLSATPRRASPRSTNRAGFTLLEVVIALAILAIGLMVLVDSQSMAVLMTVDAGKTLTGTYLAQEKMAEAMLRLEEEGFRDADIDEEGDFEEFGASGDMDAPDFGDSFEGYKWAYTIREVDIQVGDIASAAEEIEGSGFLGSKTEAESDAAPESRDLTDMGFQPDMLTDMLRPYIREVRVLVWWDDEEPDLENGCDSCIELVSHVINPTGQIIPSDGSSSSSSSTSSSGSSSSGSSSK
ncbi:MAG: prepilin-type N-terminal cleavage/methylation domain-containing protein [Pseudomonadota bacterium]|nr:prepilin-type N-terminal cleavage/methylation domain-containing protein [Pseudomonadota bacterium]